MIFLNQRGKIIIAGSSSMPKKKEIKTLIESKFSECLKPSMLRDDAAGMVELTSNEAFSPKSLLSELLQNCSDAGREKKIAVTIAVRDDFLIVQHTGAHFNYDDTLGIISCAKSSKSMEVDERAIGHKGIGFKAVFLLSDYVCIYSTEYCSFRFDKNYVEQAAEDDEKDVDHSSSEEERRRIPWQLMPVWTKQAELPELIRCNLKREQVNFFVKIKEEYLEDIKKEAALLAKDGRILLFLDSIDELTTEIDDKKKQLKLSKTDLEPINVSSVSKIEITSDDHVISQWISFSSEWPLSECIKVMQAEQKALSLGERKLPPKFLKDAKVSVTLVYQCNEKRILPIKDQRVFCYLPTKINVDFPFIVNSLFSLDLGRAHLREDKPSQIWNSHLVTCLYKMQFTALKYFSEKTRYWKQVVELIAIPANLASFGLEKYKDAVWNGFIERAKERLFLRNCRGNTAIPVSGSIIDWRGFVRAFASEKYREKFIHPQIKNVEKLEEFLKPADLYKSYTDAEIVSYVAKNISIGRFTKLITDPKKNAKLVFLLFQIQINKSADPSQKKEYVEQLKKVPFILSSNGKLLQASQLLLPGDDKSYLTGFTFLESIRSELLQKEEYQEIKSWLVSLGAKYPSLSSVVSLAGECKEHHLEIFSALLSEIENAETSSEKKPDQLEKIKLITESGQLVSSEQCYLSDELKPKEAMELKLKGFPNYVGKIYLQKFPEREKIVKQVLLARGVSQELTVENVQHFSPRLTDVEEIILFTQEIFKRYYINKKMSDKKLKSEASDLKIVDSEGHLRSATELFLPDCYFPDLKLQKRAKRLHFVSERYSRDEKANESWGKFFKALGVMVSIVCDTSSKKRVEIEKLPLGKDYLEYLGHSQVLRTWSSKGVSIYFNLDHLELLMDDENLFWLVLREKWKSLEDKVGEAVQYKNMSIYYDKDSVTVESNLIYYIKRLMMKRFSLKRIYSLELNTIYTPQSMKVFFGIEHDLPVLTVSKKVEKLPFEKFGFSKYLSEKDAYKLLEVISGYEDDSETRKMLCKVYTDLLRLKSDTEKATVSKDKRDPWLLSMGGCYTKSSELHGLICDKFTLEKPSKNVFRKIKGIDDEAYEKLCKIFQIQVIKDDDLCCEVECGVQDVELVDLILAKLPFIALLESEKDGKVTDEEIIAFASDLVQKAAKKVREYIFYQVETVVISFPEVFSQEEDYWIDEAKHKIYYTGLEPYIIRAFCPFLIESFALKSSEEELAIILQTNSDKLIRKYPSWNFTTDRVINLKEIVKQCNTEELKEIKGRKRKACDSDQEQGANKRARQHDETKIETASDARKKEIGDAAEKYVFEYYTSKYKQKYPDSFKETKIGFRVAGEKKGRQFERQLSWFNKERESFADHDMKMKITWTDEQGVQEVKQRFIEVKGTTQNDAEVRANFSEREWNKMRKVSQKAENRYDLWLVKNVGREEQAGKPIKDFYQEKVRGKENTFKITRYQKFKIE